MKYSSYPQIILPYAMYDCEKEIIQLLHDISL
jgi:hypothetical protein